MRTLALVLAAVLAASTVTAASAEASPHIGSGCTAHLHKVGFAAAPWQHRAKLYWTVTITGCPKHQPVGDGIPF